MTRSLALPIAFTLAVAVSAVPTQAAERGKQRSRAPAARVIAAPLEMPLPDTVSRVASWVAGSSDNGSLPYIIIDKQGARLFLFNAKGERRGDAPVLIGVAIGDEATPGIGGKTLAQIGPAERTTPAGRFVARYGVAAGNQRVLWVDYATSVALHPMVPGTPAERRRARMNSVTPDDNRITFGCINVPATFYRTNVSPLFRRKGGMVYILPDTRAIEDVFPRLRVEPFLTR